MKFNILSKGKTHVTNYEGAKALTMSVVVELYTAAVSWSPNDSFYENNYRTGRLPAYIIDEVLNEIYK